MKFEKINIGDRKKRILIAPLDWGLGHATRCIPIIYTLIELNFEVIIAASGPTKKLLQKEFPNVVFTQLNGYNIRYSKHKFWLPIQLFIQIPKLLLAIYVENKWLKKIIVTHNIDAVISDNRLGLYNSVKPCIYITHQLKIKTSNRFTEWLLQKTHYFFINKYSSCWVPDDGTENNLAGELSHPKQFPKIAVKYLGTLSRFKKFTFEKKYDILVLISGPEPQRTIFEEIMLKELKIFTGTVLLVRGLPGVSKKDGFIFNAENKITVANHLSTSELNKAIMQSGLVISRSGYTTIMDLAMLQKKAILIPTPGQTEQEYLADYLMSKKTFYCVAQNNFSLNETLQKVGGFCFKNNLIDEEMYKEVIKEFASQLK